MFRIFRNPPFIVVVPMMWQIGILGVLDFCYITFLSDQRVVGVADMCVIRHIGITDAHTTL